MAKLLGGTIVYGTGTVQTILYVQGTTNSTSTASGALQVVGGAGIGRDLWVGGTIYGTFAGNVTGVATTATNIAAGSAGLIPIQSSTGTTAFINTGSVGNLLQFQSGNTATFISTSTLQVGYAIYANTATNVAGGTAGQLHYQSGVGATSFAGPGNSGQLLMSSGTSAPLYVNTASVVVGNAANIAAGTAGQLVYQSNIGTTAFVSTGSVGQLLMSSGTSAPLYVNTSSIVIGNAANIAGGLPGFIPIQSSAGTTAFIATGTVGYLLQMQVGNTATWVSTASITSPLANTATNISGGVSGQLVYQSAPGVTSFVSTGTAGNVLVSNGSGAPTYNNTLTLAGTVAAVSTNSGALQVAGGVGVGGDLYLGGNVTQVGGTYGTLATTYNLINTTATTVNFAGAATALTMGASASGTTTVRNNLTVAGNLTIQGTTTVVDSTVTNIADPIITLGGGAGNTVQATDDNKDRGIAFKWNTGGATRTGFFGYQDSTGYFTFITSASIVNEVVSPDGGSTKGALDAYLAGGTAQSLVYQSSPNITSYLAAGTSGYILQTNGTGSAPSWVSTGSLVASNAISVQTVLTATNASFFPSFVSTNNASPAALFHYTTSSFVINPYTGNVGIGVGTTAPAGKLDVAGDVISQSYVNGTASYYFQAKKSRGTISAPAVVVSGDTLGGIIGGGYDGTAYQYSGAVQFRVDGAVSAGVVPMAIQLMTGNTNSYTERMRIDSTGTVGIGSVLSNTSNKVLIRKDSVNAITDALMLNNGTSDNQTGTGVGINLSGVSETNANIRYAYIRSATQSSGNDHYLAFGTNANLSTPVERMRITANGGISFGASGTAYGTSGQILQSNGDAAPTWVSTGSLVATNAVAIQTVLTATNAAFYPSFVSANNSTPATLFHYTTSTFSINPNTGAVVLTSTVAATSATSGALVVSGGVGIGGALYVNGNIGRTTSTTTHPLEIVGAATESTVVGAFRSLTTASTSLISFQNTSQAIVTVAGNTGSVLLVQASSQYLSIASNANLALGAGDFTVEGFYYLTQGTVPDACLIDWRNGTNGSGVTQPLLEFQPSGSLGLNWYVNASNKISSGNAAVAFNTWQHFAVSRVSGTTSMYIAGNRVGSPYTDGTTYPQGSIFIGHANDGALARYFPGYVSNIRIIVGTGLYSGTTLTVPITNLLAVTNTKLLLNTVFGGSFLADSSGAGVTVTNNNAATSSAFAPFQGTATTTYNDIVNIGSSGTSLVLQTAAVTRFAIDSNGIITISSTTSASSTVTGALQVVGGVGIGGTLYAGAGYFNGTVTATNFVGSFSGTISGTSTNATNILTISTVTNASYYPTFVSANNSTAAYMPEYTTSSFSINPSTGVVSLTSTAAASSTNTGALRVTGGVGIGGSLYAGGNLSVLTSGAVTSANAQVAFSNQTVYGNAPVVSGTNLFIFGGSNQNGVGAPNILIQSTANGNPYNPQIQMVSQQDGGAFGPLGVINFMGFVSGTNQSGSAIVGYSPTSGGTTVPGGLRFYTNNGATATTTLPITTLSLQIDQNSNATFYSTSATSSPTTGALTVAGGVGISGTLYVGALRADATTSATTYGIFYNPTTKELTTASSGIAAGTATTSSLVQTVGTATNASYYPTFVSANNSSLTGMSVYTTSSLSINPNTGVVTHSSTVTSTSTSTGALQVYGGIGVGGNVNIAGTVVGGSIRTNSTSTPPPNPTVGDMWYYTTGDTIYRYTSDGTTSTWVDITGPAVGSSSIGTVTAGTVYINNTTTSGSTTTGALVVAGGVGIGGTTYASDVYTNGTKVIPTNIQQFTASASQTTFTVSGGYTVGTVQVFANGINLGSGDFTAANGTTVIVNQARNVGDIIRIISGGISSSINNIRNFSIAMSIAMSM
jgi:hypothetical protein